jgi:hypothetical protein
MTFPEKSIALTKCHSESREIIPVKVRNKPTLGILSLSCTAAAPASDMFRISIVRIRRSMFEPSGTMFGPGWQLGACGHAPLFPVSRPVQTGHR